MAYAYDAAGRLVKEGAKTYRYGYLDKVLSVTEGKTRTTYSYHVDGQLASATKTVPGKAGGSQSLATASPQHLNPSTSQPLFTGKPHVDGLGHAFLMRNYRAGLGKWLTADPLGYPDGWNQLAYCNNEVMDYVDWLGGRIEQITIVWVESLEDKFVCEFIIGNEIWEYWQIARTQKCQQTTLYSYEMVPAIGWADKVSKGLAVLAGLSGTWAVLASSAGVPLGALGSGVAGLIAGGSTLLSALLALGNVDIEHMTSTELPIVRGEITYVDDFRFVGYIE